MNIGLFFGSFNPIHIGHLIIAEVMADQPSIDEVWFVVSPHNPFKSSKSLLHEFDRLKMVELAIEDNFHFKASDIEFHMPRPSYTVDTLTYLADKFPQHHFSLIMGGDNLDQFSRWKNHDQILEKHGLLVYPRPGMKDPDIGKSDNITMVDAPLMHISATFIRKAIQQSQSVRYLLSDKVLQYIEDKKLFID